MNLPEMLDSNARKNPHKDCLRVQGKVFSYLVIKELAERAAGLFQSQGFTKGERAAVIALPHPEWGETVGAIVVPAKGKSLSEDVLKAFLADKIAKYKIPRTFKFVESLPHTPSGKVMKYKLREEYR